MKCDSCKKKEGCLGRLWVADDYPCYEARKYKTTMRSLME